MATVRLTTKAGLAVEYVDEVIGQGGMKDVYMSPDRTYVVAFFRDPLDFDGKKRLDDIVNRYGPPIVGDSLSGSYWQQRMCWPTGIVEHDGLTGVVAPTYGANFFFSVGSLNGDVLGIRGKEKEGKWFSTGSNRKRLDAQELGDWAKHLQLCLNISRAVRRLHAAGLAHSDLSYKNVLVDPVTGSASIIDIDGLVVPRIHAPDVVGTPDFIAPEVIMTQHLDKMDPNRILPSVATDRHALATLIYLYLLYRHPLRGSAVYDSDPAKDEATLMGERALFIEHPTDGSNRVDADDLSSAALPWGDPTQTPYTLCGPELKKLFDRAFIEGLHNPTKRPSAAEWETALLQTIDLLVDCTNSTCWMGKYVFDRTRKDAGCPLCGNRPQREVAVLNFYSRKGPNSAFFSDNESLVVFEGAGFHVWHTTKTLTPNERLTDSERQRLGYFAFHDGTWVLVNERLDGLRDLAIDQDVPIGGFVRLVDCGKLQISTPEYGERQIFIDTF
jgi:serine/threonine protein kinase